MQILDIKDDCGNTIRLNESSIHMINTFNIQVTKEFLSKNIDKAIHILYKEHPKLLNSKIDSEGYLLDDNGDKVLDEANNAIKATKQKIDLPIELIEVLILGMAVKSYSIRALTNDPRTGTSYVLNPYIDRYELAIQKAINYGYLPQENLKTDVSRQGFI